MITASERAVWETLLPSGKHPVLPGLLDAGFEAFYDDFRASAPLSLRLALRAALWSCTWVAPCLAGRLPPLSRLQEEDRERALEALGRSRVYLLRQMLLVVKLVASLRYGADRRVRDALGFPRAGAPPRVSA